MSVHVPKLENDARASVFVLAFTVMASPTRAGVKVHASALELPDAIAYVTPSAIELRTAVSVAASAPAAPRLMLATAGAPGDPVFRPRTPAPLFLDGRTTGDRLVAIEELFRSTGKR